MSWEAGTGKEAGAGKGAAGMAAAEMAAAGMTAERVAAKNRQMRNILLILGNDGWLF
jgi:hypothetical protein